MSLPVRARRTAASRLAWGALAVWAAGGCALLGPRAVPLSQRCTEPEVGYSLSYPAGWFTNTGEVVPPCRYFHPQPFTLTPNSEVTGVAIEVKQEPVPLETFVDQSSQGAQEVLLREERTLAGRPAVRLETRTREELGLLPAATRVYTWAVAVEEGVLRATILESDGLDYEGHKAVLDGMMATLQLPGEASPR